MKEEMRHRRNENTKERNETEKRNGDKKIDNKRRGII